MKNITMQFVYKSGDKFFPSLTMLGLQTEAIIWSTIKENQPL